MSMKVKESYGHAQADYVEQLKAKQEPCRSDKAKEAGKAAGGEKESDRPSVPQDEYVSSEKSGAKPSGLYRLGQDEHGNRKIFFEDPKKSGQAEGAGHPFAKPEAPEEGKKPGAKPANPDNPGDKEEKCVGNTNRVEQEIRKLKQEKKTLEQQIRSASGQEEKVEELEKKLAQVESELSQKDNDTYRRQHTDFTE